MDPQVGTTEGKTYDVLFVGTTRGRVIKAINAQSADSRDGVDTVIIEELQVSYVPIFKFVLAARRRPR